MHVHASSADMLQLDAFRPQTIQAALVPPNDFCLQDYGMQKILPDTSFLAEWRDKIEALVITHGHEDHIGAMPWVVPALQPGTPIFAGEFSTQLIQRRLREFNLYDESRFHVFRMRERFQCGPFECGATLSRPRMASSATLRRIPTLYHLSLATSAAAACVSKVSWHHPVHFCCKGLHCLTSDACCGACPSL
jgi:hypothetical protein